MSYWGAYEQQQMYAGAYYNNMYYNGNEGNNNASYYYNDNFNPNYLRYQQSNNPSSMQHQNASGGGDVVNRRSMHDNGGTREDSTNITSNYQQMMSDQQQESSGRTAPSSNYNDNNGLSSVTDSSNGAVRKQRNQQKNKRGGYKENTGGWKNDHQQQRYGSGRTITSSSGAGNSRNDYAIGNHSGRNKKDKKATGGGGDGGATAATNTVDTGKSASSGGNTYQRSKNSNNNNNNNNNKGTIARFNNNNNNTMKESRNYAKNYNNSGSGYYNNQYYGKQQQQQQDNNYYYNNNYSYDRYNKSSNFRRNNPKNSNWRTQTTTNNNDNNTGTVNPIKLPELDAGSRRETLEQMLMQRKLECLVCCDKVRHTDPIWSCQQCYVIIHLSCVIAWAKTSKIENNGWRCPACQNVCNDIPQHYQCYCGKMNEPRIVPGVTAHACGDTCMRKGRLCEHKCTILCHPGPCPDCDVMVTKLCGCGATQQSVKCSSDMRIVCMSICKKLLNCGLHYCARMCHQGECGPCADVLEQVCFCGKVGRRVDCVAEFRGTTSYACGDVCGKLLSCGNHTCTDLCHEGECGLCKRDVQLVDTCPCGKSRLTVSRQSCLDPIPCCDKICGKSLKCGQPSRPHTCKLNCHEDECPPCLATTFVRCRCGHMDKEIPCQELTTKADDARCEKKCTKKRLCGKHRCNQHCCIEIEHICPLPCNYLLACGWHRCDRTCHSGLCPRCMETSFEELYCECGANVLLPPIPCGTRPPQCTKPCSRPRSCGHDVNHTCHTGSCPPCTVLCKRWCHGKHEQRATIPCHQGDFSCGLACGRPMPCGRHKCTKPCHLGACPLPCKQPCSIKRSLCGHACNVPCHKPPCRETSCRQNVLVTCECGVMKSMRSCIDLIDEYKSIEMANLKDKMGSIQMDQTVDLTDIVNNQTKIPPVLKILECSDECRVIDRNRRLAIGLQIRNPDLTQKLTPRYSEFMRSWAKKDGHFCQRVHDKLSELVQLAKQSKQKSRSHSFESMNRDKRHFIHEYCEHFGCESAAYDMEPHRNIVATAIKDKSWLPSMSLMEVIQRENGQRKVPGPVLSKSCNSSGSSSSNNIGKSESVSLKLSGGGGVRAGLPSRPNTPPREKLNRLL